MRNKLVLIILAVLLAVAAYFYFNKRSGTMSGEYTDFAVKDTADITGIFISTQANKSANLQKIRTVYWEVNGNFRARQDAIDLLLETFYRIDVKAPVPQSAFENVVKHLAGSGIKVEIYLNNNNKPEKIYYVGDATENNQGTYMLLEKGGKKSSRPVITYLPGFFGYLSTRFFTEERLWRDRTIFAYAPEDIRSLKIDYVREPEKSFKILKDSDGVYHVERADGKQIEGIDRSNIDEYLGRYKSVHFEYLEIKTPDAVKDSILNSTPLQVIEVTDESGKVRQLITFYKPVNDGSFDINTGEPLTHNLDRCLGWIDKTDFVAVQYITLDELLITADDIENASHVNK